MRYLFFLFLLLGSFTTISAQNTAPVVTKKKLKVVFHLTSSDTLAQKALVKQLNNFLVAAPKARLEVVCHNNGITFLQKGKTQQADKSPTSKGAALILLPVKTP